MFLSLRKSRDGECRRRNRVKELYKVHRLHNGRLYGV